MNSTLVKRIRLVLTVVAIVLTIMIIANRVHWMEVGPRLESMKYIELALLLLLMVGTRLPQAEALRVSLRDQNTRPTYGSSFWAISVKAFFNQLVTGAGLVAQGTRLKLSHSISIPDFAYATWIQFVTQIMAVALAGIIAAVLFALHHTVSLMITIPWLLLLGAGILLLHAPRQCSAIPLLGTFIPAQLHNTTKGGGILFYLLALQTAVLLFRLARLGLILAIIAPDISISLAVFAFMVGEIAVLFPVTPGGIGLRELLLGAGGLGVAGEQLVLAGVMDRVIAIIVTVVFGLLALTRKSDISQVSR